MTNDVVAKADRPSSRRSALLAVTGLGLVLVAGVGLVVGVEGITESRPLVAVFGAFLLAVSLVSLAPVVLEWRLTRHRPGPHLGTTSEGLPATVIARMGWTVGTSVAATAVLGLCLGAAGVVVLVDGNWIFGLLLVALGVLMLSYLVPVALGRVKAGGLYFSAHGIEHRKDGSWWRVAWDDVEDVSLTSDDPLPVILRSGAAVQRGQTTRWGWQRNVKAPEGVLGVQTRYLAEDAAILKFLIVSYVRQPELRSQLGTQQSLEWEIFRDRP